MILEINNTTKKKINSKLLKKAANIFGKKMKVDAQTVSLAFVGESRIRSLNKNYRKIDKVTNVLSFVDKEENFLGEVIICYPQIERQAKQQKVSINEELIFIFIHGLLHLLGYKDKTLAGKEEMEKIGLELCKNTVGKAR